MHLARLVLCGGIALASGGCATDRVTAAVVPAPTPSLVEVLAGRVAGLRVTPPSHSGRSVRVVCRLGATPTSHPLLVLVDGRPVRQGQFATSGITPERIASIEVVTRAGMVERYGPDAAYGVVLITLTH